MNYLPLVGRILFSAIFLITASGHFLPATIEYAAAKGVPLASIAVPFSGIMEIIGALSIAVGYRARFGAWLIVLFLIPVTFSLHNFWAVADPIARYAEMVNFLKNLSLIGGALMLAHFGAGPFSVDQKNATNNAQSAVDIA